MKLSMLNKAVLGSAFAASITVLSFALPVKAQTDTTTTTPGTDTTTGVVESEDDDGFDWGLLGLLGLLGLAGLSRKRDDRPAYRDPSADPATTTRSDYTNLR